MFRTVRPISLSKLPKLEHNQLVKNVIEVLEKFDLKELRLETGMEMLQQLRPELLKLEDDYGRHPLSDDIQAAKERRLVLAGFLSSYIQLLIGVDMKKLRDAVAIVKHPVRKCLLGIRKNDQTNITGLINVFFREVDENTEVQEAFEQLGLQDCLDELREMNTTYHKLFYERISSISKRPTRESKPIQKYCQAVLRNLFEHIELTQRAFPDKDYSLLIVSLNTLLAKYTKTIKRRITYNKKRAQAAAKKAAEMQSKEHTLVVDDKETGSVIEGKKAKSKKKTKINSTKEQIKRNTEEDNSNITKPALKNNREVIGLNILEFPPEKKK